MIIEDNKSICQTQATKDINEFRDDNNYLYDDDDDYHYDNDDENRDDMEEKMLMNIFN